MAAISLVRHGQASLGAEDYDQLSDLGKTQARHLGQWLVQGGHSLDRVVTGSLKRHKQTAETCAACFASPASECLVDSGFDEFDHREVLVRHSPEFEDRKAIGKFLTAKGDPERAFQAIFVDAVRRWTDGNHDDDYRESWTAFKARCIAAFDRLLALPEKPTWVFTSGGTISVLCQHILEVPDRRVLDLNWALVNTGVTTLSGHAKTATLQSFNVIAHLQQAGARGLVTYR